MKRLSARVSTWLAVALALAGCTTRTPAPRWHSVVAAAPVAAAASAPAPAGRSLAVGLVTVPDEVDRPQLVVRDAAGTPQRLDGERWSEPLEAQLPRSLALALAHRLPGTVVATHDGGALLLPTWRLAVDVQRFELQRDPDRAVLRAVWTLRPGGLGDAGATAAPQVFEVVVPAAGATPAALVAAMAAALDQLSGRIAQTLTPRPLPPAGPG
jgi:uncharacterized lipoprotein YmbA